MTAYYNEFNKKSAAMLRQLIKDGLIAPGEVDERSITEVKADEIRGFTQCYFFAGIGGWSVALRQAGWPDDRPVWTGSCPCQPFSTAGKREGGGDERHLWPTWSKLIGECRPAIIFGEQVSSAVSHGWLDGVYADMEAQGYACGSAVLPACSVNTPHKRDRLWFVAHAGLFSPGRPRQGFGGERLYGKTQGERSNERDRFADSGRGCRTLVNTEHNGSSSPENRGSDEASLRGCAEGSVLSEQSQGAGMFGELSGCAVGDTIDQRSQGFSGDVADRNQSGRHGSEPCRSASSAGFWDNAEWIVCGDGKARRIPPAESGIRIVAHGLQHRAPLLHAFGNAIVPEVAARFIKAVMP